MAGFNNYEDMLAELRKQHYHDEKLNDLVMSLTVNNVDLIVKLFNIHCMPKDWRKL